MDNKFPRICLLILFVVLIAKSESLIAQSSKFSADTAYITLDEFISRIETRYHLNIYYRTDWLQKKKINAVIINEPPEECLARIKTLTNCDYLTLDSTTYILIPYESASIHRITAGANQYSVIGNISEYGKYSTAKITGKILDGKTGVPIIGAYAKVRNTRTFCSTDRNGNFSLTLPVGEYDIDLSCIGYEDNSVKIKLVSDGVCTLEVFEKSVKLDEVVILADRADNNISRTQMSIINLDAKSIRKLPVSIGENDIIKSVSLMPGIQSSGEFGAGFIVRGGSADQNLILVEGVPLFNSSHVFGLTSVINSDGINSVSLLKAGIPAKFGERVSSIMDIRLGGDKEKISSKGGIGLLNSRLILEGPIIKNKLNFQAGIRNSYSNWLLHKMPDVDLMNSSASFYDLYALITADISKKSKITAFAYQSNDKFNFTGNNRFNYSNTLASFRYNQIISRKLFSSLLLGISNYSYQVSEYDSIQKSSAYKIESSVLYKSLKLNFNWLPNEHHSIDFGFNAINYKVTPGNLLPYSSESTVIPYSISQENANELAGYVSDEIEISPNFGAELGLRYSSYRLIGPGVTYKFKDDLPHTPSSVIDTSFYTSGNSICSYGGLEPRLALRIKLTESSSIKISYNRINQYINLVSQTAVLNPSDVWKLSSLNIRPLIADQYVLGFFKNIKNNAYETSAEIYYKKLNNIIEYRNGAKILINPLIECDLINATGYNYGIELYAKKNAGKLTGWISYTYSKSMRQTNGIFEVEQVNGNTRFQSNYDKPHNIILMSNYNLSRRWHFSTTFIYNTGKPATLPEFKYFYQGNQIVYYSNRNEYRLPDYHRLDIAITLDESLRVKKKWKGSWTLSVINVYGRKNAYSVFYKKEQPSESNHYQSFSLYKLYIIGRPLPTLTYNFNF